MSFAFSKSVGPTGVILMSKEPWYGPGASPSGLRHSTRDSSPPLPLRTSLSYRPRIALTEFLIRARSYPPGPPHPQRLPTSDKQTTLQRNLLFDFETPI